MRGKKVKESESDADCYGIDRRVQTAWRVVLRVVGEEEEDSQTKRRGIRPARPCRRRHSRAVLVGGPICRLTDVLSPSARLSTRYCLHGPSTPASAAALAPPAPAGRRRCTCDFDVLFCRVIGYAHKFQTQTTSPLTQCRVKKLRASKAPFACAAVCFVRRVANLRQHTTLGRHLGAALANLHASVLPPCCQIPSRAPAHALLAAGQPTA